MGTFNISCYQLNRFYLFLKDYENENGYQTNIMKVSISDYYF